MYKNSSLEFYQKSLLLTEIKKFHQCKQHLPLYLSFPLRVNLCQQCNNANPLNRHNLASLPSYYHSSHVKLIQNYNRIN